MKKQGYSAAALLLCFVIGASRETSAAEIVLGPRIDLSPTTFALPINIIDGVAVESWQFDLTYDANDVQVNAGCDPFGGDPYCSLLTGPVTEGDFFANGAPFNLLNPGFIALDPMTLVQTGLLFGAMGTFGGLLPLPSGNGTLALVEFTILGDGSSVITVDGSAVTPVPEPGTLALLATGLVLARGRRLFKRCGGVMRHVRVCATGLVVLGTLTLPARSAEAQTTAVGPYYATPAWDQTLPCTSPANCPRFVVLSNFNSEAVLDRETGLVWQRTPFTEAFTWRGAQIRCNEFVTSGNRLGWRVPTLQELASLIDLGRSDPALPAGHPFNGVQLSGYYFTATEDSRNTANTWIVSFAGDGDLSNGINGSKDSSHFVWCVRGGQGAVVQ